MAITLDGTTGITAPGVTDTGNLSVTGTSTLTGSIGNITAGTINSGAITSSGLVTGTTGALYPIVNGTAVASTSGTSIDFTSIPSWVKRITVMFDVFSTNGSSNPMIQIGDSGGIETTSYTGSTAFGATYVLFTTGLGIAASTAAASVFSGQMIISKLNGNTWVSQATVGYSNAGGISTGAGSKTLSDTLDRIRITTVNGTDTFDAGSINIQYE